MRRAMARIVSLSMMVLLAFSAYALIAYNPLALAAPPKNCQVPSPPYPTISSALADSTCGNIKVAPGTYAEQLTITRPVTIQGSGPGPGPAHSPSTVIQPLSVSENAPATHKAAVIAVLETTGVSLTNLMVDGSVASASINNGCSPPAYGGIVFVDASGTVQNDVVENLYQATPSQYGCQSNAGLGIYVVSPTGSSMVTIKNNVVENFQKNGITCNSAGSTCTIQNNVVTPLAGATSATGDGSNGIQVGFGASATVTNNQVSGNECNVPVVCGSNFNDPTGNNLGNDAAGILLYEAADGTTVQNNQVSSCDFGISVVGPDPGGNTKLQNNKLTDNRYVGIAVESGSYTVKDGQITSSSPGATAAAVFALTSMGDSSSSITLQNVHSSLPYFTYATDPLTAYIYFGSP